MSAARPVGAEAAEQARSGARRRPEAPGRRKRREIKFNFLTTKEPDVARSGAEEPRQPAERSRGGGLSNRDS